MSDRFPHLQDTDFPNLSNVNVWQYQNNFDYSKFDTVQMHIKLCSVPWDLGEVHVGLKAIPMGNVVGWESVEERDTYLNALQGIEWDTKYRSYHDGDTIRLDVPYEYLSYYNYMVVDYSEPVVMHPNTEPVTRWLYFIRDLKQIAQSTTQAEIKRDSWSMFIHAVDISHMVLERGHYAMSKSATVAEYLASPKDKTDYLLTPDVSYGTPSISKEVGVFNMDNEEMYYVIACTGAVRDEALWGTAQVDPWQTAAQSNRMTEQTSPSYSIFAVDGAIYTDFWDTITSRCPQFLQTVKAVYLMSKTLVEVQEEFTFFGVKCYRLQAKNGYVDFASLTADSFNYGRYADLTKLYTSPYCYIEVTDGEGKNVRINVEDCTGDTLQLCNYISIAFPYMNVRSYLSGIGDSEPHSITYHNLSERTFDYKGQWWRYFWDNNIPTYAVIEGGKSRAKHDGWYSRKSAEEQAHTSADASYTVSRQNATVSRQIAYNGAQGAKDSTAAQNSANSANTGAANAKLSELSALTNALCNATTENDNTMVNAMANADADAKLQSASISANAGVAVAVNSANASVATSAIGGVASVAGGAISGGAAGAVSGAVSAVAGIAGASVNAATTVANAQINSGAQVNSARVGANLTTTQAGATIANNTSRNANQNSFNSSNAGYQSSYNSTVTANSNSAASSITSINASVTKNNAQRQYIAVRGGTADSLGDGYASSLTIDKGSATIAKETAYSNAEVQKVYSEREIWLQAPSEYGSFAGGETQVVKPKGLWCSLVTQPKDCIAQAGTEMMRYGYMYDGVADFETFNVMTRYSYWKCADIWMTASNLPDAWVDEIRNYLLQGVTVWRKPEYINHTSIFDNERV